MAPYITIIFPTIKEQYVLSASHKISTDNQNYLNLVASTQVLSITARITVKAK